MRYMIDVRYGLMSTGSRVDVKDIHETRVAAALALSLAGKVSLTEALFSLPWIPFGESEVLPWLRDHQRQVRERPIEARVAFCA